MEDRLRLSFIEMYGECPEPIFLNGFTKELALLKSSGYMDKLCTLAEEFEKLIDRKWPSYFQDHEDGSIILNMLGIKKSRYGSRNLDSKEKNGQFLIGRPLLPFDLKTGEVTLLTGRPGTGKTELACRAADLVRYENRKVIYFALDEDIDSLKLRLHFSENDVLPADVIFDTTRELTVLRQHYGYSTPLSPDVMLEHIEEMSDLHYGVGLVVIDFMQMFGYTHATMRRLKELAEQKHFHVLALSAVSRASEGRLPQRRDIDPALLDGPDQIIGLFRTWGAMIDGESTDEETCCGAVE